MGVSVGLPVAVVAERDEVGEFVLAAVPGFGDVVDAEAVGGSAAAALVAVSSACCGAEPLPSGGVEFGSACGVAFGAAWAALALGDEVAAAADGGERHQ